MTLREALARNINENYALYYMSGGTMDGAVEVWYSGEDIIQYLNERWGLREVIFTSEVTDTNIVAAVGFSFRSFFNNEQQMINNWFMRNALTAMYNPLDNYNGHEVRLLSTVHRGQGGCETHFSGVLSTAERGSGSVNTTTSSKTLPDLTNKLFTAGFNSAHDNPPIDNISTQTGSTTVRGEDGTTNSSTGNNTTKDSSQKYENTSDNFDHHEREELTRGGNLGVTTSQQMIQSEIDLRTNPWLIEWLEKWVNSITFYKVNDDWGCNDGCGCW